MITLRDLRRQHAKFQQTKISEESIVQSFDAEPSNSGTFVLAPNILHSSLGVQMCDQVILDSIEIRKDSDRGEKIMFE